MNSKTVERRAQCINCGINIVRLRRIWVAEESEELRQLLSDWTSKELEDNDLVCSRCYNLLHFCLENEDKSRRFGHKHVCLMCGYSIIKRQTISLDNHPELNVYAAQRVPSHMVKQLEIICTKCFLKAQRSHKQHLEANEVKKKAEHSDCNGVDIKDEPLDSIGYGELDIPASESEDEEDECIPEKDRQPSTICLTAYKRAADTASHCIFKHCKETSLSTFPKVLAERLLIDYSYYVPAHSRICQQHKVNTHQEWAELVNNSKISDFHVHHIENLCTILKNCKHNSYCSSFETAIHENDLLCQYWLGVNYEKYEEIVKKLQPHNKRIHKPKRALAMYLIKRHTDFSFQKLALFFGVGHTKAVKDTVKRIHNYLDDRVNWDHDYVATPSNKEGI